MKIYLVHGNLDGYSNNRRTFAFSSEEKARAVLKRLGDRSHLEVLDVDELDTAVQAMLDKKQPWQVKLGREGSISAEPVSSLNDYVRALENEVFENGSYGHYAVVFAPSADQAIATARTMVARVAT